MNINMVNLSDENIILLNLSHTSKLKIFLEITKNSLINGIPNIILKHFSLQCISYYIIFNNYSLIFNKSLHFPFI